MAAQPGLHLTLSETQIVGFVTRRLISNKDISIVPEGTLNIDLLTVWYKYPDSKYHWANNAY